MPEPEISLQTYYQLLGIQPTASAQQIRRAYRDLSKLYHPDTTELPADEATRKFQELNEAYATLSSPDRRWAYDQQIGFSRIPVIRPAMDFHSPVAQKRRDYPNNAYLDPSDRPLSAGEVFALFILGLTFAACLALVVTIGLTKGETALAPLSPPIEAEAPGLGDPLPPPPLPTEAVPTVPSRPVSPPIQIRLYRGDAASAKSHPPAAPNPSPQVPAIPQVHIIYESGDWLPKTASPGPASTLIPLLPTPEPEPSTAFSPVPQKAPEIPGKSSLRWL